MPRGDVITSGMQGVNGKSDFGAMGLIEHQRAKGST